MDLVDFYKTNISGSDLEKFIGAQAGQYIQNQIVKPAPTPKNVVSPSPVVIQTTGTPMGQLSSNTWMYIGVVAVVLVTAIFVFKK